MDRIDQIEKDIQTLTIQGATNVALATLEGITIVAMKAKNGKSASAHLYEIGKRLAYARPTEPLAQNALRYIFAETASINTYLRRVEEYKSLLSQAKINMAESGSVLIKDGGRYLTHCHSSTVTSIFIDSHKSGKRFSIIATETRPLYQGRMTVKELSTAGINVTMIVDDAVASMMADKEKPIDAAFIGADLLSREGFVNKIGSLALSIVAKAVKIPLYVTSILLKYDPRSFSPLIIEKRTGEELWTEAPEGVKLYNPAFDFVSYGENIKIICEDGIISGREVHEKTITRYPFLRKE